MHPKEQLVENDTSTESDRVYDKTYNNQSQKKQCFLFMFSVHLNRSLIYYSGGIVVVGQRKTRKRLTMALNVRPLYSDS